MKNTAFLFLILLLFSCKKEEQKPPISTEKQPEISKIQKEVKLDTTKIFGVYQLTDKDFAISIPVQMHIENDTLSETYTKL